MPTLQELECLYFLVYIFLLYGAFWDETLEAEFLELFLLFYLGKEVIHLCRG